MIPVFVIRPARAMLLAITGLLAAVACTDRPSPLAPGGAEPAVAAMAASRLAQTNAGRQLIQVQHGRSTRAVAARVRELGGRVERAHDGLGLVTVRGLTPAAVASLRAHPDVLRTASDRTVRWIPAWPRGRLQARTLAARGKPHQTVDQSTAQFFPLQWNILVVRANSAWKITREGQHTLVCDLDTGVDPTHIDLAGKIDLGVSTSFVITEPDILDRNTHGTYVSALISSNGIGMASVAPEAELCQVKVLDQTGVGSFADIITGVIYATDAGADVINMSLGALLSRQDPNVDALVDIFQDAIDYAHRRGVTIAAAAGNQGEDLARVDSIELPAELRNVIGVGATAPTNQKNFDNVASYSNFGFPGVTVFAPGGDFQPQNGGVPGDLVLSACSSFAVGLGIDCSSGRVYVLAAGTSAASPHVAAEAAILESDVPRRRAERSEPITKCIINGTDRVLTARRFPDATYGFGRIDIIGGRDCRHTI
jgi:lantibiotic leader peptide-processing serine protease